MSRSDRKDEANINPEHHETKNTTLQPKRLPIPPLEYEIDPLRAFIARLFGDADGEVLTWAARPGGNPGYPITPDQLFTKLEGTRQAMALYFGTATCKRTEDGQLRNRKAQMTELRVIGLDDIGSKVDPESLPVALRQPTYIIETSPGNFQYGYHLAEPIADPALAEALVRIVYESGFTDSGGGMPTKLLRLPGGVNGKPGEKGKFRVRLVSMDGPKWRPERLLRAVESDVKWEDLQADAARAMRTRQHVTVSYWSAQAPESANADGVVDPVLEWLYENKMVLNETLEWVDIKCPWCGEHSNGDPAAGYSPIGRGEGVYHSRRGFHCFHDSCAARKTPDFLSFVVDNGGPEVGITDMAARLVARWAYDASLDAAWDLRTRQSVRMQAFRNLHPQKVKVFGAEGKTRMVPETSLWLTSPNRLTVRGALLDASTHARVIVADDGERYLNTYRPPAWGDGDYDKQEIRHFRQFLMYLIPDDKEREYFLDWVASKAKDMTFRGAAILMVTPMQGTGRTTLADMLMTLYGLDNCASIPFHRLIGHSEFNEWQEKPFVNTDETLNTEGGQSLFRAYEAFKDIVDFRPKPIRINAKYQPTRAGISTASYLLFSNHLDAIKISAYDRRLMVIRNPDSPRPPEYFTELNKWLERQDDRGRPVWATHVWRWLRERKVEQDMYAPALTTDVKRAMLKATRGPLGAAIDAILENWTGRFIWHGVVCQIVASQQHKIHADPATLNKRIQREMALLTAPMNLNIKIKVTGIGQVRPRMIKTFVDEQAEVDFLCERPTSDAISKVAKELHQTHIPTLTATVARVLTEDEY